MENIKIGEKFNYENQEFICIYKNEINKRHIIGINLTHIYMLDTLGIYGLYKIKYFIKNPYKYKIYLQGNTHILQVEIYETCIDFFENIIFDQIEKIKYLNLIEDLYNKYNEKHQLYMSLYDFK